ncbi:MAG: DUF3786 domain-containing protein [Armatimonadota bacterium]
MELDSNLTKGYENAFAHELNRFRESDPNALSKRSLADYDKHTKLFSLKYLNSIYSVSFPDGIIKNPNGEEENSLPLKILLLHYINNAYQTIDNSELIPYRNIPGAATYEPSFIKRAVLPMVKTFDNKPDLFLKSADSIGGVKANFADVSVKIIILPLFEVVYGIWHSDEEYSARGIILFKSCRKRIMSPECIISATSNAVYAMIKYAKIIDSK